MREIEPYGLYIISDQYYLDYPNENYMQNKSEARPHYYAIRDNDGIYWMIPLSTKVEKYRARIKGIEEKHGAGKCFMYYLAKIHGTERAILICDMFPVTEQYILRPFTINESPYIVQNSSIKREIDKRAKRYLSMVKTGKMNSPLNIIETKNLLLQTV